MPNHEATAAQMAPWERLADDRLMRHSAWGLASYLVNSGGRVLRANAAAKPAPALVLRADRLCCATKADQARLDRALANAAMAAVVRLSAPPADTEAMALVAPLAADFRLVTLLDAGARARTAARSLAMLAPSLGLTAREADVAALISAGVDIGEAARRLGLAAGTARNYLKNAMRKLDVHSQVELAALVAELSNLAIA
jgi:DNA-binding CsgD family transcriptional regulator